MELTMKNLNLVFIFFLVFVISFSASLFAGNKTITNGVLQIPKCIAPPTIDGVMDPMWKNVTAYPLLKWENGPADSLQAPYIDHFTTFRVMWDEDNFYAYVVVVDDTLNSEQANPWSDDCVELFFDGYNKKLGSMDDSTVQWRWVYGVLDTGSVSGFRGPGTWVWTQTNSGYDLELAISRDSLGDKCPLVDDQVIGFEVSNNDNDNATDAQHVLHWWTTNGNTWNNPSLYGTAILSSTRLVSSVLTIPKTDTPPIIDGVMDIGEWDIANELTLEQYEGAPAHPESLYTTMGDHFATAFTMWDDDNFYGFFKVTDDTLNSEQANPWSDDCIELFFDGYNKKLGSMDDSTVQWRWVYGVLDTGSVSGFRGPGTWVWTTTAHGFNLELAIPKDSLGNKCPLVDNQVIGFEVSNNDNDNATDAQHVLHWWTTNGNTWNNPSLYGTAVLQGPGEGVEQSPGSVITDYRLEQNYPNPFNPATSITYTVPKNERVKLVVYNMLGSQVALLENRVKNAGTYTVNFDAKNLSSGVYFYKLETGSTVLAKKMMLIK
jgi:hypothetical protein